MSGRKLSVVVLGRNMRDSTVFSMGRVMGPKGGWYTPLGCSRQHFRLELEQLIIDSVLSKALGG
jgi:hypothetical protein